MTTPAMRTRLTLSCGLLLALSAAGCATSSRLASLPPEGVNLSGEWVLDVNLSDDQDSIDALNKVGAKKQKKSKTPASGEGSGDAATDIASASASSTLPQHISIHQDGPLLRLESGNPPEPREYTTSAQTPCGASVKPCSAGWRGPVFVIDTHPQGSKDREETYALDDEGHLILTLQNGGVFAKLAYDRERPGPGT
jgi:hypothetical protein